MQKLQCTQNPAKTQFFINVPEEVNVTIYDMLGRTVISKGITANNNAITVSSFSKGLI